ncbi:MAG: 7TM-DISM domain-containing protein, partial [Brachymonas sp.]
MFDLHPQDRLWIRVDIERKSGGPDHAYLWIPLTLIDSVTLYQPDGKGGWRSSAAGDRVAVASWPEPGRYPRFHLELPEGKSTLYLQIQSSTPVSIPMHLGAEAQAHAEDRSGFLALGSVFGVLLTLVLVCFVTAYTYKDRLYFLYGLYMLLLILAVSAYTGLAAYLLWDQSPLWADASQGALAIVAAGCAFYFIEDLLGGRVLSRKILIVAKVLSAACVPLAVIYSLLPKSVGVVVLALYMLEICGFGLGMPAWAWKRGNRVG